jgi:hypothetical protein
VKKPKAVRNSPNYELTIFYFPVNIKRMKKWSMDGQTKREYTHFDKKTRKGRKLFGDIGVNRRIFLLSNFV